MAEELRLNIVSTADSRGLNKAAQDMKAAETEANKLGDAFGEMGDNAEESEQKVSAATKGVRSHTEQIKILRAEYEKTTRTIADLDAQLLGGEGDSKGIRKDLREQRAFLAELQRVAKEVKRDSGIKFSLGDAGGGIASAGAGGLGRIGGMPTPVIAGLVAAVSAAGPAIGAIIGGAIAGATGTAAMALGIASAAQDSRVQAAAQKFGKDISSNFFAGGEAFVQPVIDGLGILSDAFHELDLGDTLAKAAPTVTVMAQGIADFVKNLKPGFDKALERIGPFADAAAEGIGEMGDALGDMLDMISSSKGSVDGINALFAALNGTIRLVGAELQFLGDRWHEIINVAGMFTSIGAHTGFADLDKGVRELTGHSGELNGQIQFMGTAGGEAAKKAHDLATGLKEVDNNAIDATAALKDFYDAQLGQIDATIAFEQSLDDLADGFKEHGNSMNADLQEGRDNLGNFTDAIEGAIRKRDELAATGNIEQANAEYKKMVDRIREVMRQAGFTKAAIDAFVKPYEFTITTRYVSIGSKPSFIASNYSQPAQDAMGAGRRASGGPVTAGMPYIVGENQPELFVPSQNGYIYPSVSRGMSGGGGGAPPVHISFAATGDPFLDAVVRELRKYIRIESGGNVQAALGN